jgi:hypothetical protein
MSSRSRRLAAAFAAAFAALVLAATPAAATSFVMVADRDLADQAPLIVTGWIVSASPAIEPGGAPATDYAVAVDRALKGSAGESALTVRSPGGVRSDGLGVAVFGAPRFADGERVLLFLDQGQGGVYHVLHLMLGAFRERTIGGLAVWVREIGEAVEVSLPGRDDIGESGPRERDGFVRWLEDRAVGAARPAPTTSEARRPVRGRCRYRLPSPFSSPAGSTCAGSSSTPPGSSAGGSTKPASPA